MASKTVAEVFAQAEAEGLPREAIQEALSRKYAVSGMDFSDPEVISPGATLEDLDIEFGLVPDPGIEVAPELPPEPTMSMEEPEPLMSVPPPPEPVAPDPEFVDTPAAPTRDLFAGGSEFFTNALVDRTASNEIKNMLRKQELALFENLRFDTVDSSLQSAPLFSLKTGAVQDTELWVGPPGGNNQRKLFVETGVADSLGYKHFPAEEVEQHPWQAGVALSEIGSVSHRKDLGEQGVKLWAAEDVEGRERMALLKLKHAEAIGDVPDALAEFARQEEDKIKKEEEEPVAPSPPSSVVSEKDTEVVLSGDINEWQPGTPLRLFINEHNKAKKWKQDSFLVAGETLAKANNRGEDPVAVARYLEDIATQKLIPQYLEEQRGTTFFEGLYNPGFPAGELPDADSFAEAALKHAIAYPEKDGLLENISSVLAWPIRAASRIGGGLWDVGMFLADPMGLLQFEIDWDADNFEDMLVEIPQAEYLKKIGDLYEGADKTVDWIIESRNRLLGTWEANEGIFDKLTMFAGKSAMGLLEIAEGLATIGATYLGITPLPLAYYEEDIEDFKDISLNHIPNRAVATSGIWEMAEREFGFGGDTALNLGATVAAFTVRAFTPSKSVELFKAAPVDWALTVFPPLGAVKSLGLTIPGRMHVKAVAKRSGARADLAKYKESAKSSDLAVASEAAKMVREQEAIIATLDARIAHIDSGAELADRVLTPLGWLPVAASMSVKAGEGVVSAVATGATKAGIRLNKSQLASMEKMAKGAADYRRKASDMLQIVATSVAPEALPARDMNAMAEIYGGRIAESGVQSLTEAVTKALDQGEAFTSVVRTPDARHTSPLNRATRIEKSALSKIYRELPAAEKVVVDRLLLLDYRVNQVLYRTETSKAKSGQIRKQLDAYIKKALKKYARPPKALVKMADVSERATLAQATKLSKEAAAAFVQLRKQQRMTAAVRESGHRLAKDVTGIEEGLAVSHDIHGPGFVDKVEATAVAVEMPEGGLEIVTAEQVRLGEVAVTREGAAPDTLIVPKIGDEVAIGGEKGKIVREDVIAVRIKYPERSEIVSIVEANDLAQNAAATAETIRDTQAATDAAAKAKRGEIEDGITPFATAAPVVDFPTHGVHEVLGEGLMRLPLRLAIDNIGKGKPVYSNKVKNYNFKWLAEEGKWQVTEAAEGKGVKLTVGEVTRLKIFQEAVASGDPLFTLEDLQGYALKKESRIKAPEGENAFVVERMLSSLEGLVGTTHRSVSNRSILLEEINWLRFQRTEAATQARLRFEQSLPTVSKTVQKRYEALRKMEVGFHKGSVPLTELVKAEADVLGLLQADKHAPVRSAFENLRRETEHSRALELLHSDIKFDQSFAKGMHTPAGFVQHMMRTAAETRYADRGRYSVAHNAAIKDAPPLLILERVEGGYRVIGEDAPKTPFLNKPEVSVKQYGENLFVTFSDPHTSASSYLYVLPDGLEVAITNPAAIPRFYKIDRLVNAEGNFDVAIQDLKTGEIGSARSIPTLPAEFRRQLNVADRASDMPLFPERITERVRERELLRQRIGAGFLAKVRELAEVEVPVSEAILADEKIASLVERVEKQQQRLDAVRKKYEEASDVEYDRVGASAIDKERKSLRGLKVELEKEMPKAEERLRKEGEEAVIPTQLEIDPLVDDPIKGFTPKGRITLPELQKVEALIDDLSPAEMAAVRYVSDIENLKAILDRRQSLLGEPFRPEAKKSKTAKTFITKKIFDYKTKAAVQKWIDEGFAEKLESYFEAAPEPSNAHINSYDKHWRVGQLDRAVELEILSLLHESSPAQLKIPGLEKSGIPAIGTSRTVASLLEYVSEKFKADAIKKRNAFFDWVLEYAETQGALLPVEVEANAARVAAFLERPARPIKLEGPKRGPVNTPGAGDTSTVGQALQLRYTIDRLEATAFLPENVDARGVFIPENAVGARKAQSAIVNHARKTVIEARAAYADIVESGLKDPDIAPKIEQLDDLYADALADHLIAEFAAGVVDFYADSSHVGIKHPDFTEYYSRWSSDFNGNKYLHNDAFESLIREAEELTDRDIRAEAKQAAAKAEFFLLNTLLEGKTHRDRAASIWREDAHEFAKNKGFDKKLDDRGVLPGERFDLKTRSKEEINELPDLEPEKVLDEATPEEHTAAREIAEEPIPEEVTERPFEEPDPSTLPDFVDREGSSNPLEIIDGNGTPFALPTEINYVAVGRRGADAIPKPRPPKDTDPYRALKVYPEGAERYKLGDDSYYTKADLIEVAAFLNEKLLADSNHSMRQVVLGPTSAAYRSWARFKAGNADNIILTAAQIREALQGTGVRDVIAQISPEWVANNGDFINQVKAERAKAGQAPASKIAIAIAEEGRAAAEAADNIIPPMEDVWSVKGVMPDYIVDRFEKLKAAWVAEDIFLEGLSLEAFAEALNEAGVAIWGGDKLQQIVADTVVDKVVAAGIRPSRKAKVDIRDIVLKKMGEQAERPVGAGTNLEFRFLDDGDMPLTDTDGALLKIDIREVVLDEVLTNPVLRQGVLEGSVWFTGERMAREASITVAKDMLFQQAQLPGITAADLPVLVSNALDDGRVASEGVFRARQVLAEGVVRHALENDGYAPSVLVIDPSTLLHKEVKSADGVSRSYLDDAFVTLGVDGATQRKLWIDLNNKVELGSRWQVRKGRRATRHIEDFLKLDTFLAIDSEATSWRKLPKQMFVNRAFNELMTSQMASLEATRSIQKQLGKLDEATVDALGTGGKRVAMSLASALKGIYTFGRLGTHVTNAGSNLVLRQIANGRLPRPAKLLETYGEFVKHTEGVKLPGKKNKIYDALSRTEVISPTVDVELGLAAQTFLEIMFPREFGKKAAGKRPDAPLLQRLLTKREYSRILAWVTKQSKKLYGKGDIVFKLDDSVTAMHRFIEMWADLDAVEPSATLHLGPKRTVKLQRVFDDPGVAARVVETTSRRKSQKTSRNLSESQLYDVFARASQYHVDGLYINYGQVGWLANRARANPLSTIFWNPYMSWSTRALLIPSRAVRTMPHFKSNNLAVRHRQARAHVDASFRRLNTIGSTWHSIYSSPYGQELEELGELYGNSPSLVSLLHLGQGAQANIGLSKFGPFAPAANALGAVGTLASLFSSNCFTKEEIEDLATEINEDKRHLFSLFPVPGTSAFAELSPAEKEEQASLAAEIGMKEERLRTWFLMNRDELSDADKWAELAGSVKKLIGWQKGPGFDLLSIYDVVDPGAKEASGWAVYKWIKGAASVVLGSSTLADALFLSWDLASDEPSAEGSGLGPTALKRRQYRMAKAPMAEELTPSVTGYFISELLGFRSSFSDPALARADVSKKIESYFKKEWKSQHMQEVDSDVRVLQDRQKRHEEGSTSHANIGAEIAHKRRGSQYLLDKQKLEDIIETFKAAVLPIMDTIDLPHRPAAVESDEGVGE